MDDLEIDILTTQSGSVVAPAGCGKTQLIADSLRAMESGRPALVLTHTNAGRAALEQRLRLAKVPATAFRVATLDSWAIRLGQHFPARIGLASKVLRVERASSDYPAIRKATVKLLRGKHLDAPLQATYSRVLIDEYQDCDMDQHALAMALSRVLPVTVLGDPLQAIFDFSGPTVNWKTDVLPAFPSLGRLATPWRWHNAKATNLGEWLLGVRKSLVRRDPIDLAKAPEEVVWIQLSSNEIEAHMQRMKAAQFKAPGPKGSVVIIVDSANKRAQLDIAIRTPGALMVEALELKDFIEFARGFDPTHSASLDRLVGFASEMMTGLSAAHLLKRVASHSKKRSKTEATPIETAALAFSDKRDFSSAARTLNDFRAAADVRIIRPEVFRLCVNALESAHRGGTFLEEAIRARERNRHLPRAVPRRAVGSTLLLKGLEADVAVVLDPQKLNRRHLYVAMTRGSKKLVICSPTAVLTPKD